MKGIVTRSFVAAVLMLAAGVILYSTLGGSTLSAVLFAVASGVIASVVRI